LTIGRPAGVARRVALGLVPTAAFGLGMLWALGVHSADEPVGPLRSAAILQQLASSGQATPAGGSFDRFEIAGQAIPAPNNRNGDVAFFASLVRTNAEECLFIAIGDRISKLAAAGDIIPSGEQIADFTDHARLALNDTGAVAFVTALAGRATGGVFVAADGKIEPVVLSGAAAPDISGGTLTSFERPAIDNSGNVAFLASVRRGRDSSDAIFLRRGGELRKLIAAGDAAPGGGIFSGLGAPAMNNHGVVAFPAIVDQGPILGGLYVIEEGQARLELAAGSPAPNGGIFAKFSEEVAINDAGAIAFSAMLRRGGPATAVFVLDGGIARTVAATGDPAADGSTFAAFPSWPVLSQSGAIGFVASLDGGPSSLAIYLAGMAGLKRLAGIGDALPDGGRLGSFPRYPAVAIGPDDAITFAATSVRDGTRTDVLFYHGPPRRRSR